MNPAIIAQDQIQQTKTPFTFCAEASELGFKPGQWPESIKVPGLGNANHFVRSRAVRNGLQIASVEYTQMFGCLSIVIFND